MNGIIDAIAAIKGKGIFLGALMGLLHELHLVYLGKKKLLIFPLLFSMTASGLVGYITNTICEASDVSQCLTIIYVALSSLNAIVIITTVQSKNFIHALIDSYTKKIK